MIFARKVIFRTFCESTTLRLPLLITHIISTPEIVFIYHQCTGVEIDNHAEHSSN
jgi:hypothetical protein